MLEEGLFTDKQTVLNNGSNIFRFGEIRNTEFQRLTSLFRNCQINVENATTREPPKLGFDANISDGIEMERMYLVVEKGSLRRDHHLLCRNDNEVVLPQHVRSYERVSVPCKP